MSVIEITPATALVTVAEAKLELGIGHDERDSQIERFIASAQSELNGRYGWVGISAAAQTLELRLDEFADEIELPYGPVIAVTSFTYVDDAGDEQAVDPLTYTLTNDGVLALVAGAQWPTPAVESEAVRIVYDVGLAAGDMRIDQMKTAILMKVRLLMDMMEPATYERAVENIVRPLKVWTV